jgi:hypothetical protein
MALPLGRGAFTLGLSDPLPGEHLAVPLLCLSGVVAGPGADGGTGGRVLVNLDLTNAQPAPGEWTDWAGVIVCVFVLLACWLADCLAAFVCEGSCELLFDPIWDDLQHENW